MSSLLVIYLLKKVSNYMFMKKKNSMKDRISKNHS